MSGPSEEARYLARWLIHHEEKFVHLLDDQGFYLDEDALAEEIDKCFNTKTVNNGASLVL